MSNSTTISPPPEGKPPLPSYPPVATSGAFEDTIRRLRAEAAATVDAARQARLVSEMAELEERAGDDAAAARDYLAAFEADAAFREPLEGIARLLERRANLKGLGNLFFDSLVEAADSPDERVRALLMRAAYLADVKGELGAAQGSASEATGVRRAPVAELASAWLTLEVLAGRTGDATAREEALTERAHFAADPTWRALLLMDSARMARAAGNRAAAVSLLDEARNLESGATWAAAVLLEEYLDDPREPTADDRERADRHALALENVSSLIQTALVDVSRGDALGVPRWAREAARAVDGWLRAAEERRALGQLDAAAACLNRALFLVDRMEAADGRLADAAVAQARIRLAEQTGDTALAAQLAARRLATEQDGSLAAALALRVAEHSAAEGDAKGAIDALAQAVANDPACLPARALQLDILADTGDAAGFASQLEAFADHLATDEARSRSFLLAAYVWATRADDVAGAKAALTQAGMFGASPETTARVARALASMRGDPAWYEDATRRLIASGAPDGEIVSLYVELLRLRWARSDSQGADKALRDLAAAGAPWLARVLEGFAGASAPSGPPSEGGEPDPGTRTRAAIEELAVAEDPERARALSVVAAMRAQASGDVKAARRHLLELAERHPDDILVATYLCDLERAEGDRRGAARVASNAADATSDAGLAAALHLEAGLEHWRCGDRKRALTEMQPAAAGSPEATRTLLGWASWGVAPDSLDARRVAIHEALQSAGPVHALALERFATEMGAGEEDAAAAELAAVEAAPTSALRLAAALGRLVWPAGATPAEALAAALGRLEECGPHALFLAAAERVRLARETGDPEALAGAARAWLDAGAGLPAALEWLGAAMVLGDAREEIRARTAAAECLEGEARESMLASAALLQARTEIDAATPLVRGDSAAARLANLELAPPGSDPRRRAAVLEELDGSLGDDAALDATALGAWARLAAGDVDGAQNAFEKVATARPNDLAVWEGLRACAGETGDKALRARASAELGARCSNAGRGASFWEEAALLWLSLGDDENADRALAAGFARDARREVTFDRLFRRTRERKDNEKLLTIISHRLEVTDEPAEIQKLFWEQARVLREGGDNEAALKALEHVTLLDPDHIGALALLGEINIRRGQFENAAAALARLAKLEGAPAKNRVTAGVAAVDLYENKLRRFDLALDVLQALHGAGLSTLPVRERLAKAAARTGAWPIATAVLEQLMNERAEQAGRIEAARLAMVIHRDRLSNPQGAAGAVVKLLSEAPMDGEALDLLLRTHRPSDVRLRLLDGARTALVAHLQDRAIEAANVRRLAEVAGALGDDARQQAALGVLASLGASDAAGEQAFAQISARKPRTPQIAIPSAMMPSILAPGDGGRLADLFVLLGPTLTEALGPTLQSCGVGRRDRVDPRSGLALRNEIASWAGAFGIQEFELYAGGKDPLTIQGIPSEPPALVVGAGVNAPLAPVTRARIARELFAVARGTTITRWRDDVTIAAIVIAACRLADVRIEHPPYAVLPEVERLLGRALPRKTRRLLPEVCTAVAAQAVDARAWSRRALASHDRIAAIAAGDPTVVLSDVLSAPIDRLAQAVPGSPRAEELLRFVLSQAYLDIRRSLGLEGGL